MPRAYCSTAPEQPLLQPRHVGEQPLVGGLAGGQEDHDLAGGPVEVLGELLDVLRQQRRYPVGPTGMPISVEVSTSAASWASAVPELAAERQPAHLAEHRQHRPGQLRGLLGHRLDPRARDPLCHRVAQPLPGGQARVDPVVRRPAPRLGGAGREVGGGVEPQLGQLAPRRSPRPLAPVSEDVVAASCWRASCAGEVVVDRAAAAELCAWLSICPSWVSICPSWLTSKPPGRRAPGTRACPGIPGMPPIPKPNGSCGPSPGRRSGLRSSSRSRSRSEGPNPNGMSLMGPRYA